MERKTHDENAERTQHFPEAPDHTDGQPVAPQTHPPRVAAEMTWEHVPGAESDPPSGPEETQVLDHSGKSPITQADSESVSETTPQDTHPTLEIPSDATQFGRFLLFETLSDGPQGVIHRALHLRLRKQVAVRILPSSIVQDEESIEHFQRMIRRIGQLSHPNLARLENAGQQEGRAYLVTEFVEGIDLKCLVDRVGPLDPAEACQLVGQALLGLAHLQEHGVYHGQLRPACLRLSSPGGAVKLTDIGLHELFQATGNSESVLKSRLPYLAPEAAKNVTGVSPGEHSPSDRSPGGDWAADIYSLGATLAFLLTGQAPVPPDKAGPPVAGQAAKLPRLSDSRSDIPAGLQEIVDRMTAPCEDRLERPLEVAGLLSPYATGCNLMQLLSKAGLRAERDSGLGESSVFEADYSATKRTLPASRRTVWITSAILGFVLLAAAAVPLYRQWSSQSPAAGNAPDLSQNRTVPDNHESDDGSVSPVAWDSPSRIEEEPPEVPSSVAYDLVPVFDERRDAFGLTVKHDTDSVIFESLEGRGIAQVPVLSPPSYTLRATIERISGDNSFGIGIPVPGGELIALLDHLEEPATTSGTAPASDSSEAAASAPAANSQPSAVATSVTQANWSSGLAHVHSDKSVHIFEAHEGQLLTPGRKLQIVIEVTADEVCLTVAEFSESRATESTGGSAASLPDERILARSCWRHLPSQPQPQLRQFGPHYARAVFVHAFQGSFRLHELSLWSDGEAVFPIEFSGDERTEERRLAERLLWRGAALTLLESSGKSVTSFESLPKEPWIERIDNRTGSPQLAIDDNDVRQITAVSQIKNFDLRSTDVTREAILALNGTHSLEFLGLGENQFSGKDLRELRDLPRLRRLMLNQISSLTDEDLSFLRRFPDLQVLCLSQCPITDAGVIEHVSRLTELEHLCLNYTNVNGDFLDHLGALRRLKELQLARTDVDDQDLVALSKFTDLTKLVLTGSKVSTFGRTSLKLKIPGAQIE